MNKRAAQILSGINGTVTDDYSGRGMYGSTTTGIVFESGSEMLSAIADILEDGSESERNEIAKALRNIRIDNLGRSVIYY